MSARDREIKDRIEERLVSYSREHTALPGIARPENLSSLSGQFVDSIHRVQYVRQIRSRDVSPSRADPSDEMFDPLKAAEIYRRQGNIDEACWLVFLSTHFGKHLHTHWALMRNIYGALGESPWTWENATINPHALGDWIAANYSTLTTLPGQFGNHRKYESIRPGSKSFSGIIFSSYISWVSGYGGHQSLIDAASAEGRSPKAAFGWLYHHMHVTRFGRLAKFDFLAMIGKLGLANIEPDSTYLGGTKGPLRGARLLFSGNPCANDSPRQLDGKLIGLAEFIGVGMQEMEDALCNWQKSPSRHLRFRG